MHILLELIEVVSTLGTTLLIGAVAVIVILIVGAVVRSRSPRAGVMLALLGLAIPIFAICGWLIHRGMFEHEMASQSTTRKVHVMKMLKGERPAPGYVTIKGIARYEVGVEMKMGPVFMPKMATAYCYPVTPPTRMRKAPVVVCSAGREPGGDAEDVIIEGIIGAREIPQPVLQMFADKSNIDIADDAPRIDEGVPEPSAGRAYALMGIGGVFALVFVFACGLMLRRKPDTD